MFKNINLNHLRYFITVAEEGSVKAACQKLKLTQPALSGQLIQLETFLGKPLFSRSGRELKLNDTGKVVLEYANDIFSRIAELKNAVTLNQPEKQAVIKVGILSSLSKSSVHEFILPFWKEDSVRLQVQERRLSSLFNGLEEGRLDLVLCDGTSTTSTLETEIYKLEDREVVFVAAPKFKELKENFPSSINNEPFLHLTKHSNLRHDIDVALRRFSINPKVVGESDDVTLLRIAASKGIGITALPKRSVSDLILDGSLIELGTLPELRSDVWALLRKTNRHYSYLNRVISKYIKAKKKH